MLLLSSLMDLEARFLHVGALVFAPGITILVIWGSPGTPKMTPEDPGLDFHRFLLDLGTLLGSFFVLVCFFSGSLSYQDCSTSSEVGFCKVWGWKSHQDPMLGRAEKTVNIEVFVRFHFLILLMSWMSSERLLDVFSYLFCTLGSLFLVSEGLGSELDCWMDAGWPSGRPE